MVHWGKIFQKGFEKISKKKKIDSQEAITVQCKEDRGRNPEPRIGVHCTTLGQNFSIFKKLEKFIQRYTLGQIFPFLSGGKLEKFERVIRNGPHEGVSPDSDRNGPRKGVRPKNC